MFWEKKNTTKKSSKGMFDSLLDRALGDSSAQKVPTPVSVSEVRDTPPPPTVHVPIEVDDPVLPVAMEPEFVDDVPETPRTQPEEVAEVAPEVIPTAPETEVAPESLPPLEPKRINVSSVTDLAPHSTMEEETVLDVAPEAVVSTPESVVVAPTPEPAPEPAPASEPVPAPIPAPEVAPVVVQTPGSIATHDGAFHTDDIFAVATLELVIGGGFSVVRTRDQALIDKSEYVVDVGHVYDPALKRFDHHQLGGAGARANTIQYASFGLVWKAYGEKLCGSKVVAEEIDKRLVQGVDSVDNGVKIAKPIFEDISPYTISDFLMSYRSVKQNSIEENYQTFIKLVDIAKDLIIREIENQTASEQLRESVREAYRASQGDKKLVIIPTRINRHVWREVLSKFPEPLYVVYQGLDSTGDNWKVEAVSTTPDTYELRKPFPASWGGKDGKELADITGVADAVFCHKGLFTASAVSQEGALAMAKIAIAS